MTVEKQVESIEGEVKILKNEVKQSLEDVQDFLHCLKFPLPLKDLDSGTENRLGIKGGLGLGQSPRLPPEPAERPPAPRESAADRVARKTERISPPPARPKSEEPEPPIQIIQPEKPPENREDKPEDTTSDKNKETEMKDEVSPSYSLVNLIANLIRWVSVAKKEIGEEKLPVFLDVYAVAAGLSDELRGVILKLAEVAAQPGVDSSGADTWSRLLLELHGILTGSSRLPQPAKDSRTEAAKNKTDSENNAGPAKSDLVQTRHVRLKLVVPVNGNEEKEFDIQ